MTDQPQQPGSDELREKITAITQGDWITWGHVASGKDDWCHDAQLEINTLMQLFKDTLQAQRRELVAKLPKPSGLNTDFDRGYDRAIKHIKDDIEHMV